MNILGKTEVVWTKYDTETKALELFWITCLNLTSHMSINTPLLFPPALILALQLLFMPWRHPTRFSLLQKEKLNFIQLTLNPGNLLKLRCFNSVMACWACHQDRTTDFP